MPTAPRLAVLLVLLQPPEHPETEHSAGDMGLSSNRTGAPRDLLHWHMGKPRLGPSAIPGTGFQQVMRAGAGQGSPPCQRLPPGSTPADSGTAELPGRSQAQTAARPARKSPSV